MKDLVTDKRTTARIADDTLREMPARDY